MKRESDEGESLKIVNAKQTNKEIYGKTNQLTRTTVESTNFGLEFSFLSFFAVLDGRQVRVLADCDLTSLRFARIGPNDWSDRERS